MSQASDPNKLTRKISMTYHKDGLVDIVAGAAIMGLGAWYFNASTVVAFVSLLPFIFFARLKNWITAPRLKMLKKEPVGANSGPVLGLLVILYFTLLIVTSFGMLGRSGPVAFFREPFPVLVLFTVLLLAAVGTGMPARFTGNKLFWYARIILYGAMYLLIITADIAFRISNGGFVVTIGAIILITGVGQILVFLTRYPISRAENQ
jgi:hypothetical protein